MTWNERKTKRWGFPGTHRAAFVAALLFASGMKCEESGKFSTFLGSGQSHDYARLSVGPLAVEYVADNGFITPLEEALTLSNDGATQMEWTAVVEPACDWLTVVPDSGSLAAFRSRQITVTLLRENLPGPGSYPADVIFDGFSGKLHARNAPQTVHVSVTLNAWTGPEATMESFVSGMDGSIQEYGLYRPAGFDPAQPSPVVFYECGYGGTTNASFTGKTGFADTHGWLLVNLGGRGNTVYDGPVVTDVFETLQDVGTKCTVDHSRLFIEGRSRGATTTFRLSARFPDLFAGAAGCDGWSYHGGWRASTRHYYGPAGNPFEVHPSRFTHVEAASPLFFAGNVFHTDLWISVDLSDTTVVPENGQKLHFALEQLGVAHTYEEGPGGHCALYWPSLSSYYDFFLAAAPTDDAAPEVRIRTNQLKFGSAFWARVDRFIEYGRFATLDAVFTDGAVSDTVDVTVSNVERYTLELGQVCNSDLVGVYTNGLVTPTYVGAPKTLTVEVSCDMLGNAVSASEWTGTAGPLEKTASLEGPVCHALMSSFVVAYGTAGTADQTTANLADAQQLCNQWNSRYDGSIWPLPEQDVISLLDTANLVIFGSADSSSLVSDMQSESSLPFNLPADIRDGQITLGANTYTGDQYGILMVYPNPLAPSKYVVVGHNRLDSNWGETEGWSWFWPDYAVYDNTLPMRDCDAGAWAYVTDRFVEAGDFDRDWRLNNEPAPAGEPRTYVEAGTEYASYTWGVDTEANVIVYVTDESGAGITGLPVNQIELAMDGEPTGVLFEEVIPPPVDGVYAAILPIASLPVARYVLTVRVVRDAGGENVRGAARAWLVIE